ncbi:MAG TPA: PQQ-binding-like beta-propeller repeat protein, partial [Roseimicrobium sp.]|nr:PQQ-binding-like beta-propeller repeat protein [Roseimicrobium sp.]
AEHIPTFDAEVDAMAKHGIEFTAWWFPGSLNDEAKGILAVIERHKIHPQLWITGGGAPVKDAADQEQRIANEVKRIRPICEAAAKVGCDVALYNHGSWFGEPENQIPIIERLKASGIKNVGIVYNLHHGHDHIDRFPEMLAKMKPHLIAFNLNGMTRDGDKQGKKIIPLGQGEFDLTLLRALRDSGWRGPVGILDHRPETDSEPTLQDNLDGLNWLVSQLEGSTTITRPVPRTWPWKPVAAIATPAVQSASAGLPSLSAAFGQALGGGLSAPANPAYRQLPITIECRAKLNSARGFNILLASDPKASSEHWEIYSYSGSGVLSVYQPGRGGEFKSTVNIADGQWHAVAAILETDRVRLYVDGKEVLDRPAQPLKGEKREGFLSIGRLNEGNLGCDGVIDDVRISNGVRVNNGVSPAPLQKDGQTIGLWNFDDLPKGAAPSASSTTDKPNYWAVEDPKAREALPLYKTIPAATPKELTPANGLPKMEAFRNWTRSHGDQGSSRFSALTQINRDNVSKLEVAWTYKSGDGKQNIQCNPIVVRGVMFTPTPGNQLTAVNAATGQELWRFKPEGRPAFRGLVYWPGRDGASERLFFTAGKNLYALDPKTGKTVDSFGTRGSIELPGRSQGGFGAATAGPAIFESTIVVPGFEKDVWAFDVVSGQHRWTFHTVPEAGEYGYDTWDHTQENAANCWGGMALDEARGIAYITTGSPKPNFLGMLHRGENLFANCVIALDVRTGKRLWHFQEIPHDIWDLDIPAPPVLTTITREGRKVDVVAAVTKIGNTLLLDRVTGKPIFPFRMRRAPVSTVPGELTAPYQPDVELPEMFIRRAFSADDVTDRTPEAKEFAQDRIKSLQYGWFLPVSDRKVTTFYGIHGGAEWTGACTDPTSGLLYVSANEIPWMMSLITNDEPPYNPKATPTVGEKLFQQTCAQCHGTNRMGIGVAPPLRGLRHRMKDADVVALLQTGRGLMPVAPPMSAEDQKALLDFLFLRDRPMAAIERGERPGYVQNGWNRFLDQEGYPASKAPWGTLNCIDLNTGKLVWKVALGEYDELKKQGVPKTGTENFGGAIVTAGGLVFCGGTKDEKIRAFDAKTGAELWSAKLPFGGYAPPSSYEVDGRQYIVITATGGGKLGTTAGDAYVAFALPEKKK